MKSENKIILDLCGGTGSWSKPYRLAGYNVLLITLPAFDVLRTEYNAEGTWFVGSERIFIRYEDVHGILAAPPCTMFSRARTTAKTPRDFDGALAVVDACLKVVWACRAKGRLRFWALENPVGLLRQFLGNPSYSFQPYWFGDRHFKFTDLWGYFNPPKKLRHWAKPKTFDRAKWASPKAPAEYTHLKLDRAGIRAITSPQFAQAFFVANK